MERLTEKVNNYWKTSDKAYLYYLDNNESVFIGNAIDKLAELEDLMELYHCNSIDDLKNRLECLEKLKEYCKKQCKYYHLDFWDDRYGSMELAHKRILEKIEELEPKGDE